jgi:PleD family two-component response regulator
MDKEICGINGIAGELSYIATRSDSQFRVEAKEGFVSALTNPLKTVDGTVGSHNRAHLHELLDEWIDNAIRERGAP